MSQATEELCHCGRPLHYSDPDVRRYVEPLIARQGTHVTMTCAGRSWRVPRHYVALHGIAGVDLARLGFEEVKESSSTTRLDHEGERK